MFPIDIDFSRLKEVLTYDPQAPMIFSSGIFLWLFAAFMIVYTLLQRKYTARILFVTLFSYYFYYKSSGTYFFLLALVTVCDFLLAQWMDRTEGRWKRKGLVTLSLGVNLGLLAYFKYTNFLGGVIASLMGGEFTALDIFLPVGISFFTFQSLSYTIDVYRKDIKPLTNILDYAFYVSFFPQLVAGPIVRARDFIPQIRKPLFVSQEMFGRGIFLTLSGLFTGMLCRFTVTSPDIAILLSLSLCCWAFILISPLILLISPPPLLNFGGVGISHCPVGCAITCTYPWEETGKVSSASI